MDKLLKLWPILLAVIGGIALWGSLPRRMEHAEATIQQHDEKLDKLSEIADTMKGYVQAVEERNTQQPAVPNAPVSVPPSAPRSRTFNDYRKPEETRPWVEVDEDGWAWCCFEATEADCDEHETWEVCE